MLHALNLHLHQDVGDNHLSTNSGYGNHSCINFPFNYTLNQVDSSKNLLDRVVLTEVVIQPTGKPRSVVLINQYQRKRNKKKSCSEKNQECE